MQKTHALHKVRRNSLYIKKYVNQKAFERCFCSLYTLHFKLGLFLWKGNTSSSMGPQFISETNRLKAGIAKLDRDVKIPWKRKKGVGEEIKCKQIIFHSEVQASIQKAATVVQWKVSLPIAGCWS